MYNMNIKEEEDKLDKFQQGRIDAFDKIEDELKSLIKPLRQAKIKTIKYTILYLKAVKALQEAMTRIETLETKVKTLEDS